ncbi:MAG: GspH/FimT family pseudopilin [Acidobacteriia bacterium]|nr:GspH/FimT family pseudopilin [Terriglobia bacterium]
MKRRDSLNGRKGFSMLEAVVVVAISLTLGTISVPQIFKTLQRQRLASTSRELMTTLEAARFVAVLRQDVFGVRINDADHTVEVVHWDGNAWQGLTINGGYDTFSNRKQLSPDVTILATGLGEANVLAFNGKGELLSSSSSSPALYKSGTTTPAFTLTSPTGSCDITVNRFGSVKLVPHGSSVQL